MEENQDRMSYVIGLYQKIKPDVVVTSDTQIKNTPIWKLCSTNGGPYQRITKWLESTVEKMEAEKTESADVFEKTLKDCVDVMRGRSEKYGESWRVMNVQSMANLCEMKLNRISNMDRLNPKVEDELIDTINYCTFALIKCREKTN